MVSGRWPARSRSVSLSHTERANPRAWGCSASQARVRVDRGNAASIPGVAVVDAAEPTPRRASRAVGISNHPACRAPVREGIDPTLAASRSPYGITLEDR